jgi:hypothetical protein
MGKNHALWMIKAALTILTSLLPFVLQMLIEWVLAGLVISFLFFVSGGLLILWQIPDSVEGRPVAILMLEIGAGRVVPCVLFGYLRKWHEKRLPGAPQRR